MARIEKILLDSDEGGWYLEIETDEEVTYLLPESRITKTQRRGAQWLRVDEDQLEALDKSLAAYRDWRAEGERARYSRPARDDSEAYDLDDPKHPTYADRMLDQADRMLDARRMGA